MLHKVFMGMLFVGLIAAIIPYALMSFGMYLDFTLEDDENWKDLLKRICKNRKNAKKLKGKYYE